MTPETSLAELLPLWRTLRDEGVTTLVTPALDYVGGFELGALDARFASEAALETVGESLRSFVGSLQDECTLHFLYRVAEEAEEDVRDYEEASGGVDSPALRSFVEGRARWLRQRTLRRTRIFLFFNVGGASPLARGQLGVRLLFGSLAKLSQEEHTRRLKALGALRNTIAARLAPIGLAARELSVADVQQLHFALLNPNRSKAGLPGPEVRVRDGLWSPGTVRQEGTHLREYTEAEQLVFEDLVEARGHLQQEKVLRRVCTLKVLPEAGTPYFAAEPLLGLAEMGADGQPRAFGYTLAVTVQVKPQGRSRWLLSTQHGLVDALKNSIPFLADKSIAKEAADRAKQRGIGSLFEELNAMSSKLVSLSVSLLLEADSLEALDARTESARAAFSALGNSELLLEDVSQLPAFLSMLPGAGPYQLRRKTATSRNAGDFLPVFAPWRGTARAASLLTTPAGDVFRFELFDKRLCPAHHGLVVADTGSGKSVSLGALTLDALASGIDAILIDNGNSWKPLTELVGGVHVPVDIKTPITPFRPWTEMLDAAGALDVEAVQDVAIFLEMCVREEGQQGFDKLTMELVSRSIRTVYETVFRTQPARRPLMSDFREAIARAGEKAPHVDDKRICENIYRRLALFVGDGLYGAFLDRPSELRFDARLLTFDMAGVSKSPTTRAVAMATLMQAIALRAAKRVRRTLVEIDEGHNYLGTDEVAERFLATCYRQMRKYDVAMWMVSQQFHDFASAKVGKAIIGNSHLKIFLRHSSGHDEVARYFELSGRAQEAFRGLSMRPGHHSDFMLLYGQRLATVRLALHPLAYWILTTDADDRRLLEKTAAKNQHLDRLPVLEGLARHLPHGAPRGGGRSAV